MSIQLSRRTVYYPTSQYQATNTAEGNLLS